jgi:RNA-binding protein PNO1
MSAPTALLQRPEVTRAVNVPLPQNGTYSKFCKISRHALTFTTEDEELILDAPDAMTIDSSELLPLTNENTTEMHIDEEGRPKFAPATNSVCWHIFYASYSS